MLLNRLMKKPVVQACKELTFATGSIYAASEVANFAQQKLSTVNEGIWDTPRTRVVAQTVFGGFPIALYSCISNCTPHGKQMTPSTGFRLLPSFHGRPPMSLPGAVVAGCVAFVLSPLAHALDCNVLFPVIKQFHSSLARLQAGDSSNHETLTPDDTPTPDDTNDTISAAAPPPNHYVPLPVALPVQQSVGTTIGPIVEAIVPGFATVAVPLYEEVFFRGLLFARLVPTIGCLPAALTSSLFFGFTHQGIQGSTYLPLMETALGFACSLLYFRTGRLLVPFALHSGVNVSCMLASATFSAMSTAFQRFFASVIMEVSEPTALADFSFWERCVADNFRSIISALEWLPPWTAKDKVKHEAKHSFLPLDFWGTEEQVSPNSPFSNDGKLLHAPVLCNSDGTLTEFAKAIIEFTLDCRFEMKDSISVNEYALQCWRDTALQLGIHVLATAPEQMKAHPNVGECCVYGYTILAWEADQKHTSKLERVVGSAILYFPSGNVSRSELKDRLIQDIREGCCSRVNLEFFIVFAFRASELGLHSIPEILKAYRDMATEITHGEVTVVENIRPSIAKNFGVRRQ